MPFIPPDPPKRLRNCWISGGRLSIWTPLSSDEALAILTLTETTAGLTRSISVANEGVPC